MREGGFYPLVDSNIGGMVLITLQDPACAECGQCQGRRCSPFPRPPMAVPDARRSKVWPKPVPPVVHFHPQAGSDNQVERRIHGGC